MIKHVVMWRLKDVDGSSSDTAKEIKVRLEALPEKIAEIKMLEVGLNFNPAASAMDVCLYSVFEDRDALARYQVHPDHVKVKDFIVSAAAEVAVVDYEG